MEGVWTSCRTKNKTCQKMELLCEPTTIQSIRHLLKKPVVFLVVLSVSVNNLWQTGCLVCSGVHSSIGLRYRGTSNHKNFATIDITEMDLASLTLLTRPTHISLGKMSFNRSNERDLYIWFLPLADSLSLPPSE
ncbi:hypothetical protein Ahia01_000026800 [Argonauta hians]